MFVESELGVGVGPSSGVGTNGITGITVRTSSRTSTQDTADLLVSRDDGTTAEQLTAVMDVVGDVCGAAAGR